MTGSRRGLPAGHFKAGSAHRWSTADGSPGFWLLASAVFAGNGLFSVWQHEWWLGVLQLLTAVFAVRAAVLAGIANKTRGGSASESDSGMADGRKEPD